jgi:hypothetical protein
MSIGHFFIGSTPTLQREEANPYRAMSEEVRVHGAEATDARAELASMRFDHFAPEVGCIHLDQVDDQGHVVAYIGCTSDRRSARRMAAREAYERGIPQSAIAFSQAKES